MPVLRAFIRTVGALLISLPFLAALAVAIVEIGVYALVVLAIIGATVGCILLGVILMEAGRDP